MLDLLSKTWRLLLIPLFALAFFFGAYFFYYSGDYDPPPTVTLPIEEIAVPSPSFSEFEEIPPIRSGLLLVDGAHGNDFDQEEITALLSRVADRGYATEFIGGPSPVGGFSFLGLGQRLSLLEERLREGDSLAVILPVDPYVQEEVDIVERFVKKGGKLLLIADPSRRHDINSLAKRFGVTFQPDYLYNTAEYDINFQDIFVRSFLPDEITRGVEQIALYTAGSIKTFGTGLATTDGNTRSSLFDRAGSFHPLAKGSDGHVLALSDLTFMIPPQSSILDNDRLVSNIAEFLTTSERRFELTDFPHFFNSDVDILLGRASLVDVATSLKSLLLTFQIGSEVRGVEDLGRDTVYLGLYEDSPDVVQYLDVAGVQVNGTLRTPFTSDISTEGSAIILLHKTQERHVLLILGDSQFSLLDIIERLAFGAFRQGLVGDLIGVYGP